MSADMDDRVRRAVAAFVRADDRTDPRSGAAAACWEAALTAAGLPQALDRVAELDDLAREHYEESERQFDRAGAERDRADVAEARVAAVLALHPEGRDPYDQPACEVCVDRSTGEWESWPCPTVRAARGET